MDAALGSLLFTLIQYLSTGKTLKYYAIYKLTILVVIDNNLVPLLLNLSQTFQRELFAKTMNCFWLLFFPKELNLKPSSANRTK